MKQAGIEPMNHERGFGMTYGLGWSREHGLWLKNDWRISTIFGCSDMVDIAKLHKQLWDGDLWWPGSKLSTSKMITYHHSNWCGWMGARSLPGFPAIGGWLHTTPVVDPHRDLIQMQLMLGDWAPSTRWQQICCKQPEMARCYGGRRRFRFWNHWKNAPTGEFPNWSIDWVQIKGPKLPICRRLIDGFGVAKKSAPEYARVYRIFILVGH